MKAMEILFDRIDELNEEIKSENDMHDKLSKALEIEQIVRIMRGMEDLRMQTYLPSSFCVNYREEYIWPHSISK